MSFLINTVNSQNHDVDYPIHTVDSVINGVDFLLEADRR